MSAIVLLKLSFLLNVALLLLLDFEKLRSWAQRKDFELQLNNLQKRK